MTDGPSDNGAVIGWAERSGFARPRDPVLERLNLGQVVREAVAVHQLEIFKAAVDFANAEGKRNVVTEMRLPVVAPVVQVAAAGSR